ncbi:hypothetical protein KW791_00410 [Candidatus Parcubacteria bacterium]|nr:hypothetical protein [Candidatus Parcubacteria bacterium]
MAEAGIEAGNELVMEILKMRQENGRPMSKYRLAKDLTVSDTAVDKWVKGESSPLLENFNKLQDYRAYLERISRIKKPFGR